MTRDKIQNSNKLPFRLLGSLRQNMMTLQRVSPPCPPLSARQDHDMIIISIVFIITIFIDDTHPCCPCISVRQDGNVISSHNVNNKKIDGERIQYITNDWYTAGFPWKLSFTSSSHWICALHGRVHEGRRSFGKGVYIILLYHSFFHGCQLNSFPFFKLITKKLPQIYLYVLKYYVTEGQRRLEVRSNGDGQNVSLDLYSGRLG